jgi:anti-sigma B factor antagonist
LSLQPSASPSTRRQAALGAEVAAVSEFIIGGQRDGDAADVVVSGELDMYTAPQLRERLVTLASEGARYVTVDLAGVNFVDSTALGVLVGGLKRLRQFDGDLRLRSPQPGTYKVLEITGLTRIFTITREGDRSAGA